MAKGMNPTMLTKEEEQKEEESADDTAPVAMAVTFSHDTNAVEIHEMEGYKFPDIDQFMFMTLWQLGAVIKGMSSKGNG